jgi:hypothetical protein
MKFYKIIILILIVFFKTGNVFSDNNIFNVNNVEIQKKDKASNDELANQAIKKGFNSFLEKILLEEDVKKLSEINFSQIKDLVTYYRIADKIEDNGDIEKINYNISFDKDKIHSLFYDRNISYSEITNKELYILPILKKNDQLFIYSQNFFYDKWNEIYSQILIDFILPLENIEVIQNINLNKDNLIKLQLSNLFEEYSDKNLALVLIEDRNFNEEKVYLITKINGKSIVKNIIIKKLNLNKTEFFEKIIIEAKKEIINIVKIENLIDIKTPSFLNAQLISDKKNNLVELNSRLKKIDLIENIFVRQFNKESIFLKIKYLGKLDKIIKKLNDHKIILKLIDDQWNIKIL